MSDIRCNTFIKNQLIEDTERELSKSTLLYYAENLNKLKSYIAKNLCKRGLPECDADEVLSNLYMSLITSRDYGDDINDYKYSLESFVKNNANMCIRRYTARFVGELKVMDYNQVSLDADGNEKVDKIETIGDIGQDRQLECCLVDLDKSLKSIEYKRYYYGVDIYVLLMLGIVRTILGDIPTIDRVYQNIGVDSTELSKLYSKIAYDEQFNDCLSSLSKDGVSLSCLNKLKEYVFFFENIVNVLDIKVA